MVSFGGFLLTRRKLKHSRLYRVNMCLIEEKVITHTHKLENYIQYKKIIFSKFHFHQQFINRKKNYAHVQDRIYMFEDYVLN